MGDLRRELDYMHAATSFAGVNVVQGTESFKGGLIGAIGGA